MTDVKNPMTHELKSAFFHGVDLNFMDFHGISLNSWTMKTHCCSLLYANINAS